MSNGYKIEVAIEHDVLKIAEFNVAMALETENKTLDLDIVSKGVSYIFQNSEYGFYVVARHQGQAVGWLMITYEWSDWRNGFFCWIQSVYVEPNHRRKGLYRSMYDFVKGYAAEHSHICGFRLYAEKDNDRAQETYKKLGMEKTDYLIFEDLY